MEPLAVEHPNGGGVADDGVGGDGRGVAEIGSDVGGIGGDGGVDEIDLESDYDKVVLEEEEDVENDEEEDVENVKDVEVGARVEEHDVEVGARVKEQNVEGDDNDDWLYEGLERKDFGDGIFAALNSALQGFAPELSDAPNIAPASGNAPNTAPTSSNAPHAAPESSNAPHAAPEWAEPALEDDLVSMDGSDDE